MRPLIGVTPLLDTKLDSYWMLPDYMQGIQRAGESRIRNFVGGAGDAALPARPGEHRPDGRPL